MGAIAGQLYSVFKLRIGFAITLTALAGMAAAGSTDVPGWKAVVLGLAILLSSASAGAFNQYAERELDSRMRRTRSRPFVTGAFRPGPWWLAGIAAILVLAVGLAALTLNAMVAIHVFLGAFVYGVVYTVWLKQRTWLNIVVGGLAGSFAVLAGASVVDPNLGPVPIILAVVLFLWTPPHFWSLATTLHRDYADAGVPMLPVVVGPAKAAWATLAHTVALVLLSLTPVAFGLGWIYLVAAASGGAYFIYRSVLLVRHPTAAMAMANFRASLLQLTALLVGVIVDAAVLS
ncbi:MAG: protoheme IX farnesyltransferase [Inquilinus sp.]|nr:protoheme IX farnesyltransferase [Inquilinus sp.]